MEKYVASCRLILCCTNPSQVIAPIRSRCVCLRIAAPSHEEICGVLDTVAHKEGLKLPPQLALKIAQSSGRNLRRALLTLEACKVQQYPFSEQQPVQLPDWQLFIAAVADDVLAEQSPKQLLKVARRLPPAARPLPHVPAVSWAPDASRVCREPTGRCTPRPSSHVSAVADRCRRASRRFAASSTSCSPTASRPT